MVHPLIAGAATADITPRDSQFLFGYPHVRRYSVGVNDPLFSSAMYLSDGETPLLLIANDVIFVSRQTAGRVRERIARQIEIPAANMMITATHTHSGPMTVDILSSEADPAVPKVDPAYVRQLEDGMVEAALKACENAKPARIGLAVADGSCVGTNRHDPAGPTDPDVPVLVVRAVDDGAFLAAMVVCSMHPTVLHEDSMLVSGDFPAMARQYLQQHVWGNDCPVVYLTGPCANLSPRHVTKANTFDEATRLGHALGRSIAAAIDSVGYTDGPSLGLARTVVDLPPRVLPSVSEAQEQLDQSARRLEMLRRREKDLSPFSGEVRTAECDWFGAEETLTLARAAATGRLEAVIASVMPAEIMAMRIGPWSFVGWPGEISVEFALEVKARQPDCYVISLANGELQGYVVTEKATRDGRYEALNALFAGPESGRLLVETTLELLGGGAP
jgi:neutral ceramidase